MDQWKKLVIPAVVVLVLVAWYAFRPERLVVNRHVDEALPSAQSASQPQPLVSGQFYGILHPTAGTATIYQMPDGTRVLRFTNFSTSNGPDVHVYIGQTSDCHLWDRELSAKPSRYRATHRWSKAPAHEVGALAFQQASAQMFLRQA
jgi:Electron transfer DM13